MGQTRKATPVDVLTCPYDRVWTFVLNLSERLIKVQDSDLVSDNWERQVVAYEFMHAPLFEIICKWRGFEPWYIQNLLRDGWSRKPKMLTEGLLWYDDSPTRTDEDKIARAAARYEQKYGKAATTCYVNPSTSGLKHLQEVALKELGITVEPDPRVGCTTPPYHFWIGQNGKKKKKAHQDGSAETNKG